MATTAIISIKQNLRVNVFFIKKKGNYCKAEINRLDGYHLYPTKQSSLKLYQNVKKQNKDKM